MSGLHEEFVQRGQGFDTIAERIYKFDEVEAVYLMSVSILRRLLKMGEDIKMLERLNKKNAETTGCNLVPII